MTTTDAAGNTTVVTRRYRVVAPPPPERLDFTLAFDFARATTSTRFTRLLVRDAPRGATLEVTCRGRSCPTRRLRGARRPTVFTQRIGTRAITLRPWIRRSLRAGHGPHGDRDAPGSGRAGQDPHGPDQPPPSDENDLSAPELQDPRACPARGEPDPPQSGVDAAKSPGVRSLQGMTCFGGIQEDGDDGFKD